MASCSVVVSNLVHKLVIRLITIHPRASSVHETQVTTIVFTIKLENKDHPRDQQIVVLIHRWSLHTSSIKLKLYP